ncbi:TetR/AcrR family transcriptional regulator, partial [Acinetobacter baumannii]|uniref:TetR/AcrR family transcriptional regulator n=1 Tax=Acinetobacter baumannii TaxID=470 RepID=UPI001D175BA8
MHDPVLESHHLVCEKPQTRRGIERRLALLLSATELFLEKGYDAVSLDDIVNHAGGSKTSIYKYFGNKDGLFTAICDYRREMFFKDICIAFQPEQTSLKDYSVHDKFHRTLILSGFCLLKIAKISLNTSFF